jgi:hypothetical protein
MRACCPGKLFFGVLLFGALVLITANCLGAEQAQNGENNSLTPTPEEGEYLEPGAESSAEAEEPCYEEDCTFAVMPLCSPPGRFWVRSDYLMWWTTPVDLPPLVTTSPQGTSREEAGVLGLPTTTVLFGDSSYKEDGRAGVRITFGGWLDRCHRWGLESDWLTLGGTPTNYYAESTGDPILARPFYNVEIMAQDAQLKAYPGVVTGSVSVSDDDYFDSAGIALRYNLCCDSCCDPCGEEGCGASCGDAACCLDPCSLYYCRTDLLVGYRTYRLGDSLSIHEDITDIEVDARYQITDSFMTRNEFHGSEIGLNTEIRRGRWSVNLLAKMAMGNNHQTVIIDGSTTVTQGGVVDVREGGIYAVRTNMGVYTRDQFVVIPQFAAELGCQVSCRLRAFVGYNLIYWAPVMRAGDQIDLNIDPRNWPIPEDPALPYPAYQGRETNFWAMGVNVGAELRF